MTNFRVHGCTFIRTGSCNRCPGINPASCCTDCPHLKVVDNVNTCLIYDKRKQKCEKCSKEQKQYVDHSICIMFPNHPFLKVIKDKECSYKFEAIPENKDKFKELKTKWQY